MALLSIDFSQLPPIEMMDIFNHLIMGKTDNDKSTLSFWRSFKEYDICMNGHVQGLGVNGTKGLDGSIFFSVCSWSYTNPERKNSRGR